MFTLRDVRFAYRSLANSPGFTALALLTLALGIGANTAIFTLVDAVMFKSLPVSNPGELYRLGDRNGCCVTSGFQNSYSIYPYPFYRQLQNQLPEFVDLAAFQAGMTSLNVRPTGNSDVDEPHSGKFVSANYFSTFGVHPVAGRALDPSDDRQGAAPVAVMSYRLWRDRYALNPAIVGGTMILNGIPTTIAGITPPEFFGETLRPDPPDFWIPLGVEPVFRGQASLLADPSQSWLGVIGRFRTSARPSEVQARLTTMLQHWLLDRLDLGDFKTNERPRIAQQHIVLTPGGSGVPVLGGVYGDGLRLLTVISALVLIIACANIANLLLARVNQFQIAVRAALGATRSRLIGQTLTEGILLALVGGALGVAVAYAGTRSILYLAFRGAQYVPIDARPSLIVLAFTFALSLLTGIVFSAAPAWALSKTNAVDSLRGGSRFTSGRSAIPRNSLVVGQAALSLVLLVAAGLLTLSLWRLEHQSFGFQTDGRLIVKINPSLTSYRDERLAALYRQLYERLNSLPGVSSASFSLYSPMEGDNWSSGISIEGRLSDTSRDSSSWDRVSPGYFDTIGTRLLQGRFIDQRDTPAGTHVAVVNQEFVRKFVPSGDPIGKHFGLGDAGHSGDFEIVGVVEDAKYVRADQTAWPTFFVPYLQSGHWEQPSDLNVQKRSNYVQSIQLRFSGRPENVERIARQTLAQIDPNLAVLNVVSFDEQLHRNFNQQRLIARLTSLYGTLALTLASIGLYGVAAYSVRRRTSEIGIRMALGANRGRILQMVLRTALVQIFVGLSIGVPLALAAGRLMSSQLYGVSGHDVAVLGVAVAVTVLSAILAAIVPARRAASVDPIRALRLE